MTGQDVLDEHCNSHFGYIAHHRDVVIFHPHVLHNDGCHGLHDDDDWIGKRLEINSSTITAAQTGGEIKSKVAKENQNQKENQILKDV